MSLVNGGYFHYTDLNKFMKSLFSSPEHKVLRVSYCDHSLSVVVRLSICLSVRPFTFSCLHSSIYKYQSISTKLGQHVYDHKISDEFDYGSNRTRTSGVICLGLKKIAIFHFVYTLASTNINQSAPNLVKIYMTIRSGMSLILGVIGPEPPVLFALELKKNCFISLCLHSYHLQISTNQHQTWSKYI